MAEGAEVTIEPKYPFVHLSIPSASADRWSAEFWALGATGIEERDETTLQDTSSSSPSIAAGTTVLVASFDTADFAQEAIDALSASDATLQPELVFVVGDEWRDAWKAHFEPFALTKDIVIKPPWADVPPELKQHQILELEPGRAFGTGLHATTSLVSQILCDQKPSVAGKVVLDVGTGSGILALVALRYGAARVDAFDNDPDVVAVVEQNAVQNGLAENLRVWAGTIDAVSDRYPWVIANIETRILVPIASELARVLADGGHLILSGILEKDREVAIDAFTSLPRGLKLVDSRREIDRTATAEPGDAWVALTFC